MRGRVVGKSNSCDDESESGPAEGKRRSKEEDESETIDSNERNDLDDPNHMKAKQMWMKPRSTSKWRNQWVGGASSVRARKRSLRPLGADKPVEQVVECGQEGKQPQGAEAKNWQSGVVK